MPLNKKDIVESSNSPELDEVIAKPPPSLIAWGIGTMTVIVVVLLLIAAYVPYPTLVNSPKVSLHVNKDSTLSVQVWMPERDLSKIQHGQPVYIRLTAYPADQFGQLRGRVELVNKIKEGGTIEVQVLVASAITDAGKRLPVLNGMSGEAYIITDRASLLRRMYAQLINVNLSR